MTTSTPVHPVTKESLKPATVEHIEEIIEMNTVKLESRYPGGFDAFRSENRKEGDFGGTFFLKTY